MKKWTTEDLVSFGNYLLSKERKTMVEEEARNNVHHADLCNYFGERYYKEVNVEVPTDISDTPNDNHLLEK